MNDATEQAIFFLQLRNHIASAKVTVLGTIKLLDQIVEEREPWGGLMSICKTFFVQLRNHIAPAKVTYGRFKLLHQLVEEREPWGWG